MTPKNPMQEAVRALLSGVGEDPEREGLDKTPERVERALRFLTRGYAEDPGAIIGDALFTVTYDEMVIIKDIDVFSMCEHHLLPFTGRVHVAYLPAGGRVVGLSKLARTVGVYARRPQIQERLTGEIADAIACHLRAPAVGVQVTSEHLCMRVRGVRQPGASMVTTAWRGRWKEDPQGRAEVSSLWRA